jgi:hypothetical protein
MTYAPATIKAAQVYLQRQTGLPWVSLGIVGDENHRGGYHQGEPNVPASDYSRDESHRDENGLSGAASALDIGAFAKGGKTLQGLSLWIVGQCKAGAPDTRDIREVIYSPDGKTVKRWDRLGIRSSGDSSHLKHTHISYHRDAEGRDKVSLFKRFFEGSGPSDLPGGIMLPKYGDSGEEVKYWQRLLAAVGESFPKYGIDGDYGDEMAAAVRSWFARQGGTGFDGRSITSWIAMRLQMQLFKGTKGDPGKDGRDGVLQLPANVAITGQVTAIDGGA